MNSSSDFAPIGGVGTLRFTLVIYPGKVNMASQGIGTTPHVCGELLQMMAGIRFLHVPYRGNLMADLLAGQVHIYFSPMPQAIAFIKDGRLRTLGVTTTKRSDALPDVPAIAEVVPGYEAVGWHGLCAPKGTPAEVIEKLNAAIGGAISDSTMKQRFDDLGIAPAPLMPAEFGKFLADETDKWEIGRAHV